MKTPTQANLDEGDILDFEIDHILAAVSSGAIIGVDPDIAKIMGAFEEDALSGEDAKASRFDHLNHDENDKEDKKNG